MAAGTNILVGLLLLGVAIALGILLGRQFGDGIELWGDMSQLGAGLAYILIFGAFLFLGGAIRIVAFVFVVLGAAMATKRGADVSENLRRRVNG